MASVEATTNKPDVLLNTAALNARKRAEAADPIYFKQATFSGPLNSTPDELRSIARQKLEQFLKVMNSRGFELKGKPAIRGPFPYFDISSDAILLDKAEYRLGGWFTPKYGKVNPVRIELPPEMVRHDKDETLETTQANLNKILKREGMRAGDPRKR